MQHYFEANKALWDERVGVHVASDFYQVSEFEKGLNTLNETELTELGEVKEKSLLHLQCHFGMDTLSWARLGANVTGLDFSEKAIEKARELAKVHAPSAKFVCANVYDAPQHLSEVFDIIFTSYGTIGWLPDLAQWAAAIRKLLKTGGVFYIVDFHPFVWMLDDSFQQFFYSYFNVEVIETEIEGSYADRYAALKAKEYGWNHPISDIITALRNEGLQLDFFHEFDFSHYNCFPNMKQIAQGKYIFEHFEHKIPYMYSLKMTL
ncbi:MAG: class I SAM-dependent methyltransferase [Bacteroidia bacterium]